MNIERFTLKQTINLILIFSLYGGMVGGVIFTVAMIPFYILQHGFAFVEIIALLVLSIIFGWIFGLIPAFITGLCFVIARNYFNITVLTKKYLFAMGFMMTVLLIILVSLIITLIDGSLLYRITNASFGDIFSGIFGTLAFGGIGGLSALILGKFVLPRI